MKKTGIAIATAISLAFFTGPLAAAGSEGSGSASSATTSGQGGTTGQGGGMTESRDDGQTTGQTAASGQTFDELDRDNDGQLDEEELSAYGATAAGQSAGDDRGGKMMERLDKDGDGVVTSEEMQEGAKHDEAAPEETGTIDPED